MLQRSLARSIQLTALSVLTGLILISLAPVSFAQQAQSSVSGQASTYYNQGIDSYNQGNLPKALDLFEKTAALDMNYTDAFYNMGSIYYRQGEYDKAERAFRRVSMLSPGDMQARYNLAMALEKQSRLQEAIKLYQQIPSTDKKYTQAQQKAQQLDSQLSARYMGTTPAKPTATTPAYSTAPKTQMPTAAAAVKPASATILDEKRVAELAKQTVPQTAPAVSSNVKLAPKAFSKGFFGPTGITIGPDGYLYVANYTKNVIYKVGANGEKTVFAQGANLGGPIGLAYNPKTQDLYVANYLKNNVARVNAKGDVTVLASGVGKPYNLYLDTYNNVLYIGEQETNILSKIDLPN